MVSPGAPGARTPSGGAGAAGCAGEAMPGRKLPGKLEQLEPAGASLLHNSRAAAAAAAARRGGGRSPSPSGPPTPAGARGGQRPGTWRGLCSAPGTRGSTRDPQACARCTGPGLAEPAAPAARTWMGALGAGAGRGEPTQGLRGHGDRGACPRPRAPPGGPVPVPPPGMRAQVPGPAGGDLGQGDPRQGAEYVHLRYLKGRRWR